jgi:predicted Zn-dependent peptidase
MLKEGVQVSAEPDVEVELVYPEDEETTVELPQETPAAEPEPAPQPEPVAEPEPQPEQVVEQPAPEPVVEQPQPEPAAEQPKPEAPRAPQQTSLFGTPVTDIRQAVSIGDRFLFQRELFGGNAEKLQQTLTELNNLHSLDEAVALVDKFGWDKQSPTYELFLNVLRRRFQ